MVDRTFPNFCGRFGESFLTSFQKRVNTAVIFFAARYELTSCRRWLDVIVVTQPMFRQAIANRAERVFAASSASCFQKMPRSFGMPPARRAGRDAVSRSPILIKRA